MLANVALTCLDDFCQKSFGTQAFTPCVRYADDFVVVAETPKEAPEIKDKIKTFLMDKVGLELSNDKTHITIIYDGFDFLGFNLRKYKDTLNIKPSKDNILEVKRSIKSITRNFNFTASELIRTLNPVILGWGNYYRHVVSSQAFDHIDTYIFTRLMLWGRRKHPNTGIK